MALPIIQPIKALEQRTGVGEDHGVVVPSAYIQDVAAQGRGSSYPGLGVVVIYVCIGVNRQIALAGAGIGGHGVPKERRRSANL